MNRMWEIRERDDYKYGHRKRMGMRNIEVDEAYECGYEDGYREAMKEAEKHFGERRSMR